MSEPVPERDEELAQLRRERDLAVRLVAEAMRTMSDDQLADLRERLDKGEPDKESA